jgi:hypothetical protein
MINPFLGHKNKSLGPRQHNLKKPLSGGYPWEPEFQNSEYEVHQVGPKDCESQNFSFLAFIETELVSRQISATATETETARDRRKKIIAQITKKNIFLDSKTSYSICSQKKKQLFHKNPTPQIS